MSDKIEKLIVPKWEADLKFDSNSSDEDKQKKYKLKSEIRECSCGANVFYVEETLVPVKSKTFNFTFDEPVDINFVCAECGDYDGSILVKKLK